MRFFEIAICTFDVAREITNAALTLISTNLCEWALDLVNASELLIPVKFYSTFNIDFTYFGIGQSKNSEKNLLKFIPGLGKIFVLSRYGAIQ